MALMTSLLWDCWGRHKLQSTPLTVLSVEKKHHSASLHLWSGYCAPVWLTRGVVRHISADLVRNLVEQELCLSRETWQSPVNKHHTETFGLSLRPQGEATLQMCISPDCVCVCVCVCEAQWLLSHLSSAAALLLPWVPAHHFVGLQGDSVGVSGRETGSVEIHPQDWRVNQTTPAPHARRGMLNFIQCDIHKVLVRVKETETLRTLVAERSVFCFKGPLWWNSCLIMLTCSNINMLTKISSQSLSLYNLLLTNTSQNSKDTKARKMTSRYRWTNPDNLWPWTLKLSKTE